MLPAIPRFLTAFALFTCLAYVSGSACTNLCPEPFDGDKCCDDDTQILTSTNDTETDGFRTTDQWHIWTGSSSLVGVLLVILIICLCCPGCPLYKRMKNGSVYRRFDRGGNQSRRRRKSFFRRGAQRPNTSAPTIDPAPSVTVIANHSVQVNVAQPCAPGQMVEHPVYNHQPHPQVAVHAPPPYNVAVHGTQPAHNQMYRQ